MEKIISWKILILSPPYGEYSYTCPVLLEKNLEKGLRVLVPFGKSLRIGLILSKDENPLKNIKLKDILCVLEKTPLLNEEYFSLLESFSLRNCIQLAQTIEHFLPSLALRSDFSFQSSASYLPSTFTAKEVALWSEELKESLYYSIQDGLTDIIHTSNEKKEQFYSLLPQDKELRKGAAKQNAVLEYLLDKPEVSKKELQDVFGVSITTVLNSLEKKDLLQSFFLEKEEDEEAIITEPLLNLQATKEQEEVITGLESLLAKKDFAISLLHGVTGSGKTFVYAKIIEKVIRDGGNVFLLTPEVALAQQLYQNMCSFFGEEKITFYHGYQKEQRKYHSFMNSGNKKGHIFIGTRSLLFLPVKNAQLFILDEEHDNSYKQTEKIFYNAKEIAFQRAKSTKSLLILGSATPDIKTYYAAKNKSISYFSLANRVKQTALPEIRFVNLPLHGEKRYLFVSETHEEIKQTLERGEQVIIMLNRRGYAPLVYCCACRKSITCPHCEVALTYHKKNHKLLCHYCGYIDDVPSTCPQCKSEQLVPLGDGTEKVEEWFAEYFPETKILRMDRDTVRKEEDMKQILGAFHKQEAQVLLGTQMVSKGHHFPFVSLVVVVDGDLGLHLPEYRAKEKIFQLLVQVAGRAGRGETKGRVIIQTRNKDHACWKYVQEQNYEGFYDEEIEQRKAFNYPPFSHLALIRLQYPTTWQAGDKEMERLKGKIALYQQQKKITLLGPVAAPLSLLAGKKRFHCMMKSTNWEDIRQFYKYLLSVNISQKLQIRLDLDPINSL